MVIQMIDNGRWDAVLAGVSRALVGKRAEIEVASFDLGNQIVAERLPLVAISYDRKNDVISVNLDQLDHLIRGPRDLYLDYDLAGIVCLEIVDGEGASRILTLSDPLALPEPQARHAD